jgi:hypothetical protein
MVDGFKDGASTIDGKLFSRIKAVGTNLIHPLKGTVTILIVVHVLFGMACNWAVYKCETSKAIKYQSTTIGMFM